MLTDCRENVHAAGGTIGPCLLLCALGALAMSFGWGFRGDYGHESGAMVPGALIAMGVCLATGREAWFRRCAVLGACGAIGWAFGGQMSYGQITSYTVSHSFPDVAYGYASLFTIGMLWGGIGAGLLSFGLTWSRRDLARFIGPLVALGCAYVLLMAVLGSSSGFASLLEQFSVNRMHDTDWIQATLALVVALVYGLCRPAERRACVWIAGLALGWWVGYWLLVRGLGLRMSPTILGKVRSDNWAGCVGLWAALLLGLWWAKNRAGFLLSCYGALAGGYGFSVGDFINKPDKVQWAPFYSHPWLQGFDHWKWTEQSFGLIMGFGVALGLLRLLRGNLRVELDDGPYAAWLNDFCAVVLLGLVPFLNFGQNIKSAGDAAWILFGLSSAGWLCATALAIFALMGVALYKHRHRTLPMAMAPPSAKAQALFFLLMYASVLAATAKGWGNLGNRGGFFLYGSFWVSVLAATALVLVARPAIRWTGSPPRDSSDVYWRLGWWHGLGWVLVVPIVVLLTVATLAMHENPMPGSSLRFGSKASHLQETGIPGGK